MMTIRINLNGGFIIDEKKMSVVKLNAEELSQVAGGIPYEKPVLLLLDEAFGAYSTGLACKVGDISSETCKKGGGV